MPSPLLLMRVRCHLTGQVENAVWAAVQGYEAVDYVAHTLGGIDFEGQKQKKFILETKYVQLEIKRQLVILAIWSLSHDEKRN